MKTNLLFLALVIFSLPSTASSQSAQLYYSVVPQNCELTTVQLQVQNIYPDGTDSIAVHFHSMNGSGDFSEVLAEFSVSFFSFSGPGYLSFDVGTTTLGTFVEIIVLNDFEALVQTVNGIAICSTCIGDGPIYWRYTTTNSPDWQTFYNDDYPNQFMLPEDVVDYQICMGSMSGCSTCSNVVSITNVENPADQTMFAILNNGTDNPKIKLSQPGEVKIFSLDGRLIETIQGKEEIFLNIPPGSYVAQIGNMAQRILVK